MKKIFLLYTLLSLSFLSYSQEGVNWNKYFIKGSLAVGKLKYNKADGATYAKNCAWLEIGGDTTTRGMIIPRVLDVATITGPVKGLIAYDLGENSIMYYDGTDWAAIGSGGGGSIGNAGYGLGKTGSTFYVDTTNIVNINYLEAQNFATEEYVDSIVNSHHHVVYAEHYTDQYGYTDSAIWAALNDAGNYGTVDGGWLSYTMGNGAVLKKGQKLRNAKLKRADETTALLTSQYDVGETFVVVDAIPAGWVAGNTVHVYTGDGNSETNVTRTITSISNDTVYINGVFGIDFPVGATVRKVFNLVTYAGFFDTTADSKLTPIYATLDNVTFDGNRVNNSGNFSWTVNSTIFGGLMEIYNCNFYDIPNENISGQAFKIFGGEAINLNGSFHHSSASLYLYELMGFSTIITNTRIINTNLEAVKNEHGDAAIEHSFSAVNVIITGNYFRNVKFAIDNFIASSVPDSGFLPPHNITFTGNIVDTCWGGGFITSPEFILDGSVLLRKGGSASFTGNTIISAGTGTANDYRGFKELIDTAFNQITFTGNSLVNTEFIWPQGPNINSDINGQYLTRTPYDNSVIIGNRNYPHIQIDSNRMAIGNRLNRPGLVANGGTLEVDNDITIRAGATAASSSARLRLCRYGPIDTPTFEIFARMDSITRIYHRKQIEFYNYADGLNKFTIYHDGIGNATGNNWFLKSGAGGTSFNVAEVGAVTTSDGYIKIPPSATYWSAQSPQLQVDYLAMTSSTSGTMVFGYNNVLKAFLQSTSTGFRIASATGKNLFSLDANDRVGFGTNTPANMWDFAGNVAADSLRLKGNISPGAMTDSVVVKGTSDKFLKSLRPANDFLLKEDSTGGTILTHTEAAAIYSPLGHTHDDRYYTETEADALLAAKATQEGLDDTAEAIRALIGSGGADGSETKVNEGTGIDVTGTGTIGDPYVISNTGVLTIDSANWIKYPDTASDKPILTKTQAGALLADYTPTTGLATLLIEDNITNGATTTAPSENAVFDALALKYDASNPSNYITGIAWGQITGTLSSQTDLQSALDAKVATSRAINSGWGINGGGNLSADRTLFLDSTEAATRSDIDTLAAGVYSAFGGSGGTVTSVDASVPAGFAISGNPVTTSGTLAITYATGQTANRFLATPDGTTGALSLRAIVAADIPTLNQNTTGSAASLTTTRTIWGQNFNGTANVTGDLALGASNLTMTGSIAATGSRVTKGWFTDIESTNPPTVGGTALPTASSTATFTNKRITPRVTTTASSATPTPDADASDMFTVTALAAGAVFAAPTGTPTDGQGLLIRIKDNGTARSLGWNAIYREGTDIALPTTTVISKTMYVQFIYNSADTKWDLVGLTDGL